VTVHAAETSVDTLLEDHLPKLLRAAADISHDWSRTAAVPAVTVS
jgi:IclR family pca regulon transcriptional regulator